MPPPRHPIPSTGLLIALLLLPAAAFAQVRTNVARLLTSDAAEVIDAPVVGLQRTALPLFAGLSVDTSLYADALLAPNLGLRWAVAGGPHRVALGARYTHFVGASAYSSRVESREPAIQSFTPELSGPAFYAVYGLSLGPVLVQGEARYARYDSDYLAFTGAVAWNLTGAWSLIAEGGMRVKGGAKLKAAAGVRYGGEHFGMALGAAYVDLSDPALPGQDLPVLPTFDLSWSFR
ncbi:hypothetical protein [Corallococcus exercitus]|uniref:hypothetical protein n=1 Tax=Corallococcus exercitus TaxID=2316736 RepID=UPI001FCA36D3|nr:hypothetical protein [Corallococcus exercitus]